MDVCFFGGYDSDYPRNSVLRWGLTQNAVSVTQVHVRRGSKFWLRYPLLSFRWWYHCRKRTERGQRAFLFVPEFCQKDVPLGWIFSSLSSKVLVFDPLASRFETKILDWQRKPEKSLVARWNFWLDRLAFSLSDLVLADTEAHKDYYCHRFGLSPDRAVVVPVGFDDRIFTRRLADDAKPGRATKSGNSTFTVLFFGSFLPLHGVETAVLAAQRVAQADRTVRFVFIGSGQTLPRAKKIASQLNLTNAGFWGWMSQPRLAEKVAREADLVLGIFGPTEKAGRVVPHKIFQAMALGKAVLTARTPAAQEFFTHRHDIYFCPAGDPEGLAHAILELRSDAALRLAIAERAYELAWERFSPSVLGAQLKEILACQTGSRMASQGRNQ